MPNSQVPQPEADAAGPPASLAHHHARRHRCQVCGRNSGSHDQLPGALVRESIAALIAQQVPAWDPGGMICQSCLNRFRMEYVRGEMERDRGELSAAEEEVMQRIRDGALVAANLNPEYDHSLTFGERVSDRVAEFGGSWRFIISFFVFLAVWITANSIYLLFQPFDPYPYILLNLALSLLAAIQAPVIMMSQNRQEARDRLRAENDYQVNLKAELEVRAVSEKLDLLIHQHWAHLLEIQQVQTEMMQDLLARFGR
jgi:uncharacterized membrane protein